MRRVPFVLVASVAVAALACAVPAPGAEPLASVETLRIPSKVLGEERTVLVSTPRGYAQGNARYAVLYLTDGDAHLLHTRATVDFLARNGRMPDVIVVGVTNTDRSRDLTPTKAFRRGPDGTALPVESSGGASRFLDFFEKELVPLVESTWRTAPFRVFAGHSLGGLFALTAFVERPGLFGATIAVSPSLHWDDDVVLGRLSRFLAERKELRHTLYVTMADEEEGDPSPTRFDRLRKLLKSAKAEGFAWGAERMDDEDHGSVVLRSHYDGLRKVFDGWRLPRDGKAGGYPGSAADLKAHYAKLSARLGYEVPPPELTVNLVGYQHLQRKDVKGALPFFRWNVELHPGSANVHDSLGEALEAAGEPAEALACYEKAVELGRKVSDPNLAVFERNRDRAAKTAGR
jgi:predicted alpha/beta superfamily hydrolase